MLNVRYLSVFRIVAKAGSISAAAGMLNVSQPAVTKTIRLLEETLGLTLFLRVNGRLVITAEAEQLLPEIERLFGNVKMVAGLADEIRQGFSGSLSIACVTTLATSLVARTLARFHERYPRVRVDIKALSTFHALNHVATNDVDIAILDAPAAGFDMDIVNVCRSEVGCIMRREHPLADRAHLSPTDLCDETLISFGDDTLTGLHLAQAFQTAGVRRNIAFTLNHTLTAYALVQAGVGVAIVDSFPMLGGKHTDLVIRPFRPLIETRPHVVFARGRAVPIVARKFVDDLLVVAAELISEPGSLIKAP